MQNLEDSMGTDIDAKLDEIINIVSGNQFGNVRYIDKSESVSLVNSGGVGRGTVTRQISEVLTETQTFICDAFYTVGNTNGASLSISFNKTSYTVTGTRSGDWGFSVSGTVRVFYIES